MSEQPRLPPLADESYDLRVRYSVGPDERVTEAILAAFRQDGTTPIEQDTPLYEWVDPDTLDHLYDNPDRHLRACIRIWDHVVIVTPEDIVLYAPRS